MVHPAIEIKLPRFILRQHRLDDADATFNAMDADRDRLRQWLPWVDFTKTAADTRRNIETCLDSWEKGLTYDYGIWGHDGEFYGRVGMHTVKRSVPMGEFGYWLKASMEGKGIIQEALKALEDEFFKLNFVRLEIRCDPKNMRSAKIPARLGYRLEACLQSDSRHNGELRDSLVFAKLNSNRFIPIRPDFIGHWSEHLSADDCSYPGSDELLSQGSAIGHKLGLKAVGIHIELLHPGRRTSWPHAESHEEEFAYVIEGTPDVWIDGKIYPLIPGDFVAFPAGTGICHTFMNNTSFPCKLLVGGETSKTVNKIYYPLHPERNEARKLKGDLWEDIPKNTMGDHDGLTDLQRGKKV